jgi:DNA-binding CsgD family transcriptional regulator/tetratricopeptide (TPR) repeat protein
VTSVLTGRRSELAEFEDLLSLLEDRRGRVVVVRGEPGIGKSALLAVVADRATARGMAVLKTSGVETEAHLPFAGLHQLLGPLLGDLNALPGPQRVALETAFGLTDGAAPDLFLIALATLDLLADVAARTPVLVIVEDAHWLDESTSAVLLFVARRVSVEPIGLLTAVRDGPANPFEAAGLSEMKLGPLDADVSRELLARHAPDLAPSVRERVLADASGNPLALIELPAALGSWFRERATLPDHLPLSARLERAFAARLAELPVDTRALLLVAAADDQASVAEVLSATGLISQGARGADVLGPATSVRLVEVEGEVMRFRHPLVRSAVYRAASVVERQTAHAALAEVLGGEQYRSVWHRAAASIGKDDAVAVELEAAAEGARRRGAIASAVAALERAAQLSSNSDVSTGRLLRAAELAVELGRLDVVGRLVRDADLLELAPLDRGRLAWIRAMADPGPPGDPGRMRTLLATASSVLSEGDADLALKLLWVAAVSGFWADRENELSRQLVMLAEQMPVSETHPWLLAVLAYGSPIDRGAVVIERISRLVPDQAEPDAMWLIAAASTTVGAFDLAAPFATASVAGLRDQGRLVELAQALVLRAWCQIHVGRWDVAMPDAEEAERLATETGQLIWAGGAHAALSILAGLRGEVATAEALATQAEGVGLQFGARAVLSVVQLARGLTSLGDGRHEDAYLQLRRMFNPSDPAYHRMESCWAIGNLAEAAARSGNIDDAREVLEGLERLTQRTPSPWLRVAMGHARALLADDTEAEALFQTGLAADLIRWPFDRARLLLAYGAWLRRQRRPTESRSVLREARNGFDALGVVAWGDRARQELRASGETSRARTPEAFDQLSPQGLQIARLASEGLTNREIGQKLYVSHRTVSSHLYRIFPKLGTTSRSELTSALERVDVEVS